MNQQSQLFIALRQLLQDASSEPNPTTAIENLTANCVAYISSSSGRLYKLDLVRSAYHCVYQVNREDTPPRIDVSILDMDTPPASLLENTIITRKMGLRSHLREEPLSQHYLPTTVSLLLLPIVRGEECLGVLELESSNESHFTPDIQDFVSSVAASFLLLFEKQHTLELLKALQAPLNYHQPLNNFLRELIEIVSFSSDMPYIVLREYDKDMDTLSCLAQIGLAEAIDKDEHLLDLHPIPACIREVVEKGRSQAEPDAYAPHLADLPDLEETRNIKSFVATAVKAGDQIFGVLSFGCSCKYEYTPLEVAGFESIANGIGVAIKNYSNIHNKTGNLIDKIKSNTVFTAVEVAQAARHEARHHLGNANTLLALISGYAARQTREDLQKVPELAIRVNEELRNISQSLDRIKNITKPPIREKKRVVLNDVWQDAFDIVHGRLASERIQYRISDKKVTTEAFPDFLSHAFLNLILNSIDAFRGYKQLRDRNIWVNIEPPSEKDVSIRMRYTDNASGIDPSKLLPRVNGAERSIDDIFEPGVTSKPDGSGFGLWLIRKIMDEHKGSINILSYRGGVQFELTLPKSNVS